MCKKCTYFFWILFQDLKISNLFYKIQNLNKWQLVSLITHWTYDFLNPWALCYSNSNCCYYSAHQYQTSHICRTMREFSFFPTIRGWQFCNGLVGLGLAILIAHSFASVLTQHYSLYNTHYTLHTLHCTPTTAYCNWNFTLHTGNCTLHTIHSTLHNEHCILHSAHSTLNTEHCTLHSAHCTLWTLSPLVYTVNWTLHSPEQTVNGKMHVLG